VGVSERLCKQPPIARGDVHKQRAELDDQNVSIQPVAETADNAPSQGKSDIKCSIGIMTAFPTSRATRSELSVDQRVKARHICPINQKTKNGRYTMEPLLWPVTLGKPSIRCFITTT